MKITEIKELLSLLGNLGVVLGIIFLVVEIQQNTSMTESQTRDAITEKQMAFYELVLSDPLITQAWVNSLSEDWEPSEEIATERLRNEMVLRSEFRMWENEWYQYEKGLFSAQEFEPRMNLWRGFMCRDSYKWYWENRLRNNHSPSFAQQIDSIITESIGCELII